MTRNQFDDFVNQQVSDASETNIDWQKEFEEWKSYLAELYDLVSKFIEKYVTERKMQITREKARISEEHVGPYDVDSLIIRIARNRIKLLPIGTIIIGAKGRVDMIGPKGKIRFVLVDKNSSAPQITVRVSVNGKAPLPEETKPTKIEWRWKISTPPPAIKI